MSTLQERDAMLCRSCGREERASEGYPCKDCGTFICIMCVFRGVIRCDRCAGKVAAATASSTAAQRPASSDPGLDWPEH